MDIRNVGRAKVELQLGISKHNLDASFLHFDQFVSRENREEGGINRLPYYLINTPRQGTILPFAHH